MDSLGVNRRDLFLKISAVIVAAMIVISSAAITDVMIKISHENDANPSFVNQSFQSRPCKVRSVLAQTGLWISFDSSTPGTPAEAHVIGSDPSGITIVADFHGFWRSNFTINSTVYDDLNMPGASSIHETGTPMLPCLFEYVEIPYNVDVTIEVIASSTDTTSGYNIRPAPPPQIPFAVGESFPNASQSKALPTTFDSVYFNDTFFPGYTTNTEGGSNTTSFIMRGHRLLGLSFYPVQYNSITSDLMVYSQLVVKVKYSIPAQIQPIEERLRSEAFDRILINTLLNYDSCNIRNAPLTELATSHVTLAQGSQEGAEYLIITNRTFEFQANRLANWKEQKGVPSYVWIVPEGVTTQNVKDFVMGAYKDWYLAPTYVLILGDVDVIPTNYDFQHQALLEPLLPLYQGSFLGDKGYIASDLGYFNIDGQSYIPDMIYGRISVDTEEQARIIVNKILQYEQDPPTDDLFYNSIFSAGYFEDKEPTRGGTEDEGVPFISTLERIRHHLENEYGYIVHFNYSSAYWHQPPIAYQNPLYPDVPESIQVSYSIPTDYDWLWGYEQSKYREPATRNITLNINAGRFLALYFGHGGSKNMLFPKEWNDDGDYNRKDRDLGEGWHSPYFNTSDFSDLTNEHELPLILSMACSTGWFDGETDETVLTMSALMSPPRTTNPFSDYENDCFAENITRLATGGAIATIAPSRPAYAELSAHLLDGIIQAFYPGHLEINQDSRNQPIYQMGAALLYGKLYVKSQWTLPWFCILDCPGAVRTTFEEYHLFGDPETKLWTDTPTWIDVSYPDSVGTSNPQKFAVTVINSTNGDPLEFAKVCIQQGDDVYQVIYTDHNGQAIFDVDPVANPSHINVTVTKHNVKPHIGTIDVIDSAASISVNPNIVFEGEFLTINFTDFPADSQKAIIIDRHFIEQNLPPGVPEFQWQVWPGPTRFINVQVIGWDGVTVVSVDCFQRVASDDGPDPYIYSQSDPSILDSGEIVWDNPDIIIKRGGLQVFSITQNEVHDIEVMVHNGGIIPADLTNVTLWYAPFVGSVSWTKVGNYTVAPTQTMSDTAYFTLEPPLPHSACLRVDLSQSEEIEANKVNNIGYECTDVIEMSSSGEGSLQVGNPTRSTNYVFIKVKQLGNHEDVWNATILGYSSQPMVAGGSETVTLFLDSLSDLQPNEERLFNVEIYISCGYMGGMVFKAIVIEPPDCLSDRDLVILLISVALVVIVIYFLRKQRD
ncbi:MAG: C25 family cysteine peptidase [Candidatus Thorarchaeota archaeon]